MHAREGRRGEAAGVGRSDDVRTRGVWNRGYEYDGLIQLVTVHTHTHTNGMVWHGFIRSSANNDNNNDENNHTILIYPLTKSSFAPARLTPAPRQRGTKRGPLRKKKEK